MPILCFYLLLLPACEGWGSLITREELAQWSLCEDLPQPTSHMEMVCIVPGTFIMGSHEAEVGRDSDENQHEVTLTGAFWIGAYEVTQAQFEELMGYNPSYFYTCSDCPVEQVSWHEAAAFANALSEEAGLRQCYNCSRINVDVDCEPVEDPYRCEGFRLPTEAEWEYAARAGSEAAFSNGGNLREGDEDNCDGDLALDNGAVLDSIAWYCGYSEGATHPVGRLAPNAWGLYDMSGNVWEWCWDGYGDYCGSRTDPVGSLDGSLRVYRGGSWRIDPSFVRVASRVWIDPSYSRSGLGFRLARSL